MSVAVRMPAMPALFGQNRKRVFFVIGNLVNAVVDLLMFADKRIGTADNIFQDIIFTGDDQILQINGTYKFLILIHNVNGGNIVMFTSLSNECTHGFANGTNLSEIQTKLLVMQLPISSSS